MANALAQNPIIIDSTLASYKAAVAASLGTLFTLRVYSVAWVGPGASGHQVEIINPQSGQQLFVANASAAGQDVIRDWSSAPRLWSDFGVPLIQSGKLYIDARM